MECIFCKIANKEVPANIVHEDGKFIVFHDIRPKAPFHVLVMPKQHIESLKDLNEDDAELAGGLLMTAKEVAKKQGLEGYKLAMNVGKEGGQEVDHIHLHLLGYNHGN